MTTTRPSALRRSTRFAACLALAWAAGCNARKDYPDAAPGWHNGDYSVIFGRLQRVPSAAPDAPPAWTIRFGYAADAYNGELALTPPERMVGYTGGERVEIRSDRWKRSGTGAPHAARRRGAGR